MTEEQFAEIIADLPTVELKVEDKSNFSIPLVDLLVLSGLSKSKSEAKRDIRAGSIYLCGVKEDK